MQPEYLALLSEHVQQFIHEVEAGASLAIEVIPSLELDAEGPLGHGQLEIIVDAHRIQIFAPTNGYFPDGAVRHEVLHVHRFHVEGVPKIALADAMPWDRAYADSLTALDNAIEHLIIVPLELRLHPERRKHWEAMMRIVCSGLPSVPESERRLAACLHWTFLRHALPNSPLVAFTRDFMVQHELLDMANRFADEFLALSSRKEEMVRILFHTFPEIPRHRAALEYINSKTGRRQTPIP
jgi:hypothetical protein